MAFLFFALTGAIGVLASWLARISIRRVNAAPDFSQASSHHKTLAVLGAFGAMTGFILALGGLCMLITDSSPTPEMRAFALPAMTIGGILIGGLACSWGILIEPVKKDCP